MSNITFHKEVRTICSNYGWDVYSTYNDKGVTHRRVSYSRVPYLKVPYSKFNCNVPEKIKAHIKQEVEQLLSNHGVTGQVYWFEAHSYYGNGPYDKLCIKIPL
jgi:hypothetical protein